MTDNGQIGGANSPEYDAFVDKFKPRHTSDDCFTPANVYETVRDWALRRFGIPEWTPVIRPFWPGRDFTKCAYPSDCVVIDNPPFSITTKICSWYNSHGVRFFIFAPGLSSFAHCRDGKTTFVSVGNTITFDNGAAVNIGFLTNMGGDVLCETACDLHDALEDVEKENRSQQKKHVAKLRHPYGTITAGGLQYLTVHHTPFRVMRRDAAFVRRLDCGCHLFGGGYILSERAAAERAAAERAAAERAAAERAAAERAAAERAAAERAAAERAAARVLTLSEREKELQRSLG